MVKKLLTFLKWFSVMTITLVIVGLSTLTLYGNHKLKGVPKPNIEVFKTPEPTVILDNAGNVIWAPTDKRIDNVTMGELPQLFVDGLIAVEDKNFKTSDGVSDKDVVLAGLGLVWSKIDKSYTPRGGSSLEQQLIKNKYYNGGHGVDTMTRKFQEVFLAKQVSGNLTKDQVFESYLNTIEYSEGSVGLAAIMKTYYGKNPQDFNERTPENIAQLAYFIGLGQAPSGYNLYDNLEPASKRKNIILQVLLKNKLISKEEYDAAKNWDLSTNLKPRYWESEAQRTVNLKYKVYTDMVIEEIASMGYNINDISMKIHTFLDQPTFDMITNTARQDQYFQDGSVGLEQIAVTVINKDGVVVGMVGSRHENDELNRAVQQTRSSGSSLKPFTAYGPLLQYMGDTYNTASTFPTSDYLYPGTSTYMRNWGNYVYGERDIQWSLRMSLNTPVARIDDEILGSARMKTFLNGLGLDIQDTYSSVDGIGLNISTLQAAAAYNALNNGGLYIKPRFVNKLEFKDGSIKTVEPVTNRAMNESTSWVLLQMLRGVPTPGFTARLAMIPEWSGYAGKTGTVGLDPSSGAYNEYGYGGSDAWYNSVTKDGYAISVWTGYDEPNSSPQVADSFNGYQQLNKALQLSLANGQAVNNWDKPSNVRDLGGYGLNAHYAIIDASDINTDVATVSVPDITNYMNTIATSVTSDNIVPENWANNVSNKKFYELWASDNDIIENTDIIDKKVWDILP